MAPTLSPPVADGSQEWLQRALSPHFFAAMRDEPEALAILSRELLSLRTNERLFLADRPQALIIATRNLPGSLYRTLTFASHKAIPYAMFEHSSEAIPGIPETLEIARFEYDCKTEAEIAQALKAPVAVPAEVARPVRAALEQGFPDFDPSEFDERLALLWLNNPGYTRSALPLSVARTLHLFQQCERAGGLYLGVEAQDDGTQQTLISFAMANPPLKGALAQLLEVFNRLDLGVARARVLAIPRPARSRMRSAPFTCARGAAAGSRRNRRCARCSITSSSTPRSSRPGRPSITSWSPPAWSAARTPR